MTAAPELPGADKVAFFRVEGVLTRRPTLAAAAFLAAGGAVVRNRVSRLSTVALAAPLRIPSPLRDRGLSTRLAWAGTRGLSEDRLEVLCEEYWEAWLADALVERGLDLVDRARRDGRAIVLVSDNLEPVLRPLADRVGAADLLCNRMEMRNGKATGRLVDPIVGGALDPGRARAWCADRGLALTDALAYGASAADATLLAAVGSPCAVAPDRELRRMARDLDWPIVD